MKEAFFRVTVILVLAFMAATQVAQAQEPLLVSIPFEFTAGRMLLPAGEYTVANFTPDSAILLIQRTDRNAATSASSFATASNAPQTHSKLVFHRYGNRYFLSQVWVAGYSRGRELPKSAKEKEQALAARNEIPDQVTIVARLMPSNH